MKKILAFLCLIIMIASVFVGCGSDTYNPDTDTNQGQDDGKDNNTNGDESAAVALQSSASSVNVGDKITVTVVFNSVEGVKTFGIRPIFDDECFELVSGRMLVTGAISNFGDGIGVVAFDETIDITNQNVMQFVLKAKKQSYAEAVGCEVSVKGADDKVIVISQPTDITVEIK